MSPYLVALLVGDWECVSGSADGIPDPRLRHAGSQRRARVRARGGGVRAAVLQPVLRHQISVREARHRRRARLLRRRDGEHRRDRLSRAVSARERTAARSSSGSRRRSSSPTRSRISGSATSSRWQWWDDIWLNEGFATWMERRPMQEWKPEWNGALDEVRDTQTRDEARRACATRPIRTHGRDAGRDQPGVRRDRVSEDRRGHQDGRGVRRARRATATASTRI